MGKQAIPAPEKEQPIVRVKKLIALDDWVVKGLQGLANADNRKLKPYMENVLIIHLLDGGFGGPVAKGRATLKKSKAVSQ